MTGWTASFSRYMILLRMESHPVPQNVTSFEFHLIGDMTIKQFAYLATGLVTAYLLFIFLFPASPLFAVPLIALTAGLGVAFAFLPIGDRPLDHWTIAFFKAVYSPTKRIYQIGSKPADLKDPQFQNRLNLYLGNFSPTVLPVTTPQVAARKPTPAAKGLEITRLLSVAQQNSTPVFTKPTAIPKPQPAINQNVSALVAQVIQQNQQLKAQLAQMQHLPPQQPVAAPPPPVLPATPQPAPVTPRPQPAQINYANTQIKIPPLTVSGPNIIAGTVISQSGVPVDGAIVIITNQNNIPVRAVKTSRMGQFTGATSLPDGEYVLSCEKDGFSCQPVKVTLKGELLTPLTIHAQGVSNA